MLPLWACFQAEHFVSLNGHWLAGPGVHWTVCMRVHITFCDSTVWSCMCTIVCINMGECMHVWPSAGLCATHPGRMCVCKSLSEANHLDRLCGHITSLSRYPFTWMTDERTPEGEREKWMTEKVTDHIRFIRKKCCDTHSSAQREEGWVCQSSQSKTNQRPLIHGYQCNWTSQLIRFPQR